MEPGATWSSDRGRPRIPAGDDAPVRDGADPADAPPAAVGTFGDGSGAYVRLDDGREGFDDPEFFTAEELDRWSPVAAAPRFPPGGPELLLARAVGDLVATYRRMHRLTQAQVARRLGVDQGRVSRLEQGRRPVSFVLLAQVAAVTGATVDVRLAPGRSAPGNREVVSGVALLDGVATVTVRGPRAPLSRPTRRWPGTIS